MDNPYQAPGFNNPRPPKVSHEALAQLFPNPLVQIVVGICGGEFVAGAFHVTVWRWTEMMMLAEVAFIPAWIVAGGAIALCSYSRNGLARALAWSQIGLGFGLLYDCWNYGGLSLGTWWPDSGLLFPAIGIAISAWGIDRRR